MSINVFSVEGLVAWLEKQDGEVEYDYSSIHQCLLCKYFRASGVQVKAMGNITWIDSKNESHELNPLLNKIAKEYPYTYSSALIRAKALLP